MRKISMNLTACALAALTTLGGAVATAQDARWFRVELLAFANKSNLPPGGSALPEQWDATPELAYPSASRFLVDPALVARNKQQFPGNSFIDEYGRQIITSLALPDSGTGSSISGPIPLQGAATPSTPKPLTPVISDQEAPPVSYALPRPFVVLPSAYQEFRGKAALMQRSGRYSILLHESWVQPVTSEDRSLPIVLDHSGDTKQWPQLQGSIKIFLSRYLLLETNLWLNTSGDYLPAGTWKMPPPPFGPPSLVVEEEEVIDLAAAIDQIPDTAGSGAETGVLVAESGGVPVPASATPLPAEGALAEGASTITEPPEVAGPVYPFRHAVLLQQKRRMRSGEVHYVEHPLMGLIIKFTPVTAEELAAIAESQAQSLGDTQLP